MLIEWDKLQKLYIKAQEVGVGFSMVHCESDNTWYFKINTIPTSEEFIGKNRTFNIALETTLEWLGKYT